MTHVATDWHKTLIEKLNCPYFNEVIQMQHFSGDKNSCCDMGYDTSRSLGTNVLGEYIA
jgi:hypothetical protein